MTDPALLPASGNAPRVALALGSGGARGYAHIGVIDELHDRGYQIVGIAGSSMGALVGGLQAADHLDEFADWARSLTQRAILRLLDPSIMAAGVLRAEKILDAVRDILGDVCIEQLPIPYTAVATDLLTGKSVWLQRGPVDEAIRASIAIPGVIAPHVVDGTTARRRRDPGSAADGADRRRQRRSDHRGQPVRQRNHRRLRVRIPVVDGMAEPDAAQHVGAVRQRVCPLAVQPVRRVGPRGQRPEAESEDDEPPSDVSDDEPEVPRLGSFEVMNRTIDIAQAALARHTLAAYPPDLLIEVPRSACRSLEFHRAAEVIDIGRALAAQALDNLDSPACPRRRRSRD